MGEDGLSETGGLAPTHSGTTKHSSHHTNRVLFRVLEKHKEIQAHEDNPKGRASLDGPDGQWKVGGSGVSMRLVEKLPVCPGGSPVPG